ncbi:MAG: helix-turn-helix domain-containing protein, partial [Oscillospiraceae bacterium]|nr:helix-turn-helix domain-containing protein [Oscillospiraceae bacterium]
MIFGIYEKIKDLRVNSGMNQVQLAKRLGITKSAVNSWETGTNSPSLLYIIKLDKIFRVST